MGEVWYRHFNCGSLFYCEPIFTGFNRRTELQVGFEMFFVAEGLQVSSELEKRERGGAGGGSLEMELAAGSFHYIFSSFPGTAAPRE